MLDSLQRQIAGPGDSLDLHLDADFEVDETLVVEDRRRVRITGHGSLSHRGLDGLPGRHALIEFRRCGSVVVMGDDHDVPLRFAARLLADPHHYDVGTLRFIECARVGVRYAAFDEVATEPIAAKHYQCRTIRCGYGVFDGCVATVRVSPARAFQHTDGLGRIVNCRVMAMNAFEGQGYDRKAFSLVACRDSTITDSYLLFCGDDAKSVWQARCNGYFDESGVLHPAERCMIRNVYAALPVPDVAHRYSPIPGMAVRLIHAPSSHVTGVTRLEVGPGCDGLDSDVGELVMIL